MAWKESLPLLEEKEGVVGQVLYVIYSPENEGGFRIQAVPVTPKSFVCRSPLKKELNGLSKEGLQKASGIADAEFVHATGFMGGCKTLEGAVQLAEMSMP